MKELSKNPIVIVVGIILTLGILAWIGYENWGWFGGYKKGGGVLDTGDSGLSTSVLACMKKEMTKFSKVDFDNIVANNFSENSIKEVVEKKWNDVPHTGTTKEKWIREVIGEVHMVINTTKLKCIENKLVLA